MSSSSIQSTEEVINHHLQAIIAVDVDAILEDFNDESVMFTPDGVIEGLDQIRSFFTEFVKSLTPEFLAAFEMVRQESHGNYAYILWKVGEQVPLGTDSFTVIDGKIAMQSLAMYAAG